jgi:putative hydrolases of HD superfamily
MLSTLIELQRLKRLDRTGWTLRGLPNGTESVAAHSFGVCTAAMLLADELLEQGISIDVEKVLRMALLHDWAEVRVGDMPRVATAYFGAEARKEAETRAFVDVVSELKGEIYTALYHDYEQRLSLESRVVKAADVLDLLVQILALERAGARGLDEFWEVAENPNFQLGDVADGVISKVFQAVLQARSGIA